jgi:CMP-N,N'-diacetyllegionaminic acid synthase
MVEDKRILGLIPARGGSKGIPRKNIRPLLGKPLLAWTIEEALKSEYLDSVIVSTDDDEIAATALEWGAMIPFIRPAFLASDTARGIDVVIHVLEELPENDVVVLLQPTSPFRSVLDIDQAIELWSEKRRPVVGVSETSKSPFWMYSINESGMLVPLLKPPANAANRQQLPKAFALNGAVYVSDRESIVRHKSFLLEDTVPYIMPAERSVDLDSEADWNYAEYLLRNRCDNS